MINLTLNMSNNLKGIQSGDSKGDLTYLEDFFQQNLESQMS